MPNRRATLAIPARLITAGTSRGSTLLVTGTLRNAALLTRLPGPRPTITQRTARIRGALIREVDALFADDPGTRCGSAPRCCWEIAAFWIRQQIKEAFQQTGSYHVLVIAGLHVGILAFALLWFCRRLRLSLWSSTLVTIQGLAAYVAIVEDRPPILRAALAATSLFDGAAHVSAHRPA